MPSWAVSRPRKRQAIWRRAVSQAEPALYNPRMHILVACDSFKDALPADAVCRAIAAGLKKNHPGATVSEMPLSDGGEGLLDVLGQALALKWIEIKAADPLGREVMARYGLSADGIT